MKCNACERELPDTTLVDCTVVWRTLFYSVRWFYWLVNKEYEDSSFLKMYRISEDARICPRCKALLVGIAALTLALVGAIIVVIIAVKT